MTALELARLVVETVRIHPHLRTTEAAGVLLRVLKDQGVWMYRSEPNESGDAVEARLPFEPGDPGLPFESAAE